MNPVVARVVVMVAALTAGCAAGDEGSAVTDWSGRDGFCDASSALEVGAPLLTPRARLGTLEGMKRNAPSRWQDVLAAAIGSVQTGRGMAARWDSDMVGLVAFIEESCGLNIPTYDPRE